MARPREITPEDIDKARDYLENFESNGHAIPSVAGLSVVLGRCRKTIYNWSCQEGCEEFLHILEMLNSRQEEVLINKGLKGDFNSAIVKLVLGKHGYHERREHTGAEGGPMRMVTTEMSSEEAANTYRELMG